MGVRGSLQDPGGGDHSQLYKKTGSLDFRLDFGLGTPLGGGLSRAKKNRLKWECGFKTLKRTSGGGTGGGGWFQVRGLHGKSG